MTKKLKQLDFSSCANSHKCMSIIQRGDGYTHTETYMNYGKTPTREKINFAQIDS
jgi:hypothetical protein